MLTRLTVLKRQLRATADRFSLPSSPGDVDVYWWRGEKNFGDLLTPAILRNYGLRPRCCHVNDAGLIVIGSVIQELPADYSGVILGSGLIQEPDTEVRLNSATILAVRGALTRDALGMPSSTPLGDPGLLCPLVLSKRRKKRYKLGVVPHFRDKRNAAIAKLVALHGTMIKVIDVQASPEKVLSQIDQCDHVLSSSLHGIICSHALGVPAGWIHLSDRLVGGDYKFRDYGTSVGVSIKPQQISGRETVDALLKMTVAVPPRVNDLQASLDRVFKQFAHGVKGGSAR